MRYLGFGWMMVVVLLGGCASGGGSEGSPPSEDAGSREEHRDSGAVPDAGAVDDADGGSANGLFVELVEPRDSDVWTQGTEGIAFDVSVEGGLADRVELWLDETRLETLEGLYQYTWPAMDRSEGTYTFVARAYVGDDFAESDPVAVHIDRTPPAVVRTVPEDGSDNFMVTGEMSVVFDDPIDPTSLVSGMMRVDAASGAEVFLRSPQVSGDGRTVSVRLRDDLASHPETLSVTLDAGLRDLAGNVTEAVEFSFVAPDWVTLAEDFGVAEDAALADLTVDNDGRPLVIYTEAAGPNGVPTLYGARAEAGAWSALGEPLNADAARSATEAKLATPTFGAVHATWLEGDEDAEGERADVRVAKITDDGWDLLGDAVSEARFHRTPDVGFDARDRPMVLFRTTIEDGDDTWFVHRYDGGSWSRMGDGVVTLDLDRPGSPTCGDIIPSPGSLRVVAGSDVNCRVYTWSDTFDLWLRSTIRVGDTNVFPPTWAGLVRFGRMSSDRILVASAVGRRLAVVVPNDDDEYWTIQSQRFEDRNFELKRWPDSFSLAVSRTDDIWLGILDEDDQWHVGKWITDDVFDAATPPGEDLLMVLDDDDRPVVVTIRRDMAGERELHVMRRNRL